jgi:hypothetical protein
VNWIRFGLTAAYGLLVFIFFFLYLAGFIPTSNLSNDILYVGFINHDWNCPEHGRERERIEVSLSARL